MEKYKELRQHLNEASQNYARLEKHIGYFESSLNSDYVLSVCDRYLIASASYSSIQIPSDQIAAIIEDGDVKGITKNSIFWIVYADLFGHSVVIGLNESEYENFLKECRR